MTAPVGAAGAGGAGRETRVPDNGRCLCLWPACPPDAFDYPLMIETLQQMKKGRKVHVPIYDFSTHSRYGGVPLRVVRLADPR